MLEKTKNCKVNFFTKYKLFIISRGGSKNFLKWGKGQFCTFFAQKGRDLETPNDKGYFLLKNIQPKGVSNPRTSSRFATALGGNIKLSSTTGAGDLFVVVLGHMS